MSCFNFNGVNEIHVQSNSRYRNVISHGVSFGRSGSQVVSRVQLEFCICNDISRGGICKRSLSRRETPLALQKDGHRAALKHHDYYLTPPTKNVRVNVRSLTRIPSMSCGIIFYVESWTAIHMSNSSRVVGVVCTCNL